MGQAGETKNGEGARKRLKISVAHFDNSALIKTYSKTLIGRCMNPEEQDMTALFTNIPKIWKLEERVTGTNLGFGKFQFDFKSEEDMEAVLKQQPFHFDYWMLALARWQEVPVVPIGDTFLGPSHWSPVGVQNSSYLRKHWKRYRENSGGGFGSYPCPSGD